MHNSFLSEMVIISDMKNSCPVNGCHNLSCTKYVKKNIFIKKTGDKMYLL